MSDVDARRISYGIFVTTQQATISTLEPRQHPAQHYVAARDSFIVRLDPGTVPFEGELWVRSTGRFGLAQTTKWSVSVRQRESDNLLEFVQSLPRVEYD
jgi:hypothetical protein